MWDHVLDPGQILARFLYARTALLPIRLRDAIGSPRARLGARVVVGRLPLLVATLGLASRSL